MLLLLHEFSEAWLRGSTNAAAERRRRVHVVLVGLWTALLLTLAVANGDLGWGAGLGAPLAALLVVMVRRHRVLLWEAEAERARRAERVARYARQVRDGAL